MQFLTFYFILVFGASALPTKQKNRTEVDLKNKKSDAHKNKIKRHATMIDPEKILFDWFLKGESYYHPGEHSRIPHQEIMSAHAKRHIYEPGQNQDTRQRLPDFKDMTTKNAWVWAKMRNLRIKDILGYKKKKRQKRHFSLNDYLMHHNKNPAPDGFSYRNPKLDLYVQNLCGFPIQRIFGFHAR